LNVIHERRVGGLGRHLALGARDPIPFENTAHFWRAMAQPATIVMCVLSIGVFLYLARALLLPVLAGCRGVLRSPILREPPHL
jgi:hypothetical protein